LIFLYIILNTIINTHSAICSKVFGIYLSEEHGTFTPHTHASFLGNLIGDSFKTANLV